MTALPAAMGFIGGPLGGRHVHPDPTELPGSLWPYALQGPDGGYVRLPADNYLVAAARSVDAGHADVVLYVWLGCACVVGQARSCPRDVQ